MKILTLYKYYNHHIQSITGENHVHLLLIKQKSYNLQTNGLMKLFQIFFPKLYNKFDITSLLFLSSLFPMRESQYIGLNI